MVTNGELKGNERSANKRKDDTRNAPFYSDQRTLKSAWSTFVEVNSLGHVEEWRVDCVRCPTNGTMDNLEGVDNVGWGERPMGRDVSRDTRRLSYNRSVVERKKYNWSDREQRRCDRRRAHPSLEDERKQTDDWRRSTRCVQRELGEWHRASTNVTENSSTRACGEEQWHWNLIGAWWSDEQFESKVFRVFIRREEKTLLDENDLERRKRSSYCKSFSLPCSMSLSLSALVCLSVCLSLWTKNFFVSRLFLASWRGTIEQKNQQKF